MSKGAKKYPTIGKSHQIDRTAVNCFEKWLLPSRWLLREQRPDVFLDYLVEIVEGGEPTGFHFAAQIKGYEDNPLAPKPLSYAFETKHLKYYLHNCLHPVFLFLINVSTGDGYWLFAQKFLKEKISAKQLDEQDTLTIHFAADDNLLNFTKFKCLLNDAERFVRDLHPGSPIAAIQKREAELEAIDPRCSVSISVQNGKQQVTVIPKEVFSFATKVTSESGLDWQRVIERGEKIKFKKGQISFSDNPIAEAAIENIGDELEIQYGKQVPGSVQIIDLKRPGKVVSIEGQFRSGTKYLSFTGGFLDSLFSVTFETTWDSVFKAEPFSFGVSFQPKKWIGHPILQLPYFDQIQSFAEIFSSDTNPHVEFFAQGNSVQKGKLENEGGVIGKNIKHALDWFQKCKWLAHHYGVNPEYPPFEKVGAKQMKQIDRLHHFFTVQNIAVPMPNFSFSLISSRLFQKSEIGASDEVLHYKEPEREYDFLGHKVKLPPILHQFSEMKFVSQKQLSDGTAEILLRGTKNTTRTSKFI